MTRIWLIGGGVFLGVLLIASIAIALLETEEPLTRGTPEAAVQNFLKAAQTEDYDTVYAFLSNDLKENCTLEDFVDQRQFRSNDLGDARIVLENTNTTTEATFVTVRITQFYGSGPFGTSESSFEQTYALRQIEGEWKFTNEPWPFFGCQRFLPEPARQPTPTAEPTPEPSPTPQPTPSAP